MAAWPHSGASPAGTVNPTRNALAKPQSKCRNERIWASTILRPRRTLASGATMIFGALMSTQPIVAGSQNGDTTHWAPILGGRDFNERGQQFLGEGPSDSPRPDLPIGLAVTNIAMANGVCLSRSDSPGSLPETCKLLVSSWIPFSGSALRLRADGREQQRLFCR